MKNTINERLFLIRDALDLSQAEFASRLGITQASVSRMEKGETISMQIIKAVCGIFDVYEDYLVNGNGEMFLFDERKRSFHSNFSRLPSSSQEIVLDLISVLLSRSNK